MFNLPKNKDDLINLHIEWIQKSIWFGNNWMDFHFSGQRIRESTKMSSRTRAREVEDKRKQELRDGSAGIRKQLVQGLLSRIFHDVSNPNAAVKRPRARCNCALHVPSATPRAWAASA